MAMEPTMRVSGLKAAVTACALLCAAVALAILATASPVRNGDGPDMVRHGGATPLDDSPLGR